MKIQLAFLVDCTEFMTEYIGSVLTVLDDVLARVHAENPGIEVQFAFVGYRDFLDPIPKVVDFADVQSVKTALYAVKAAGGGDICEDVHSGILRVARLSWDRNAHVRSIFHIADAPSHGSAFHVENLSDDYLDSPDEITEIITEDIAMRNIHYTFGRINWTTDVMSDAFRDIYMTCTRMGSRAFFSELPVASDESMRRALYETIAIPISEYRSLRASRGG
jgi:hypothetical protein